MLVRNMSKSSKPSKRYKKIKEYFDYKLWNEDDVKNAVARGVITEDEYKKIVGEEYEE